VSFLLRSHWRRVEVDAFSDDLVFVDVEALQS